MINDNLSRLISGSSVSQCAEMLDIINRVGFLPLLDSGINGYCADALVSPDCRYRLLDDGGWQWQLWQWKGPLVREGGFAYGKFFNGKAGFISREWWPDFCNWRRHKHPLPADDTVEGIILDVLRVNGGMITRELRAACGFTGPKMRSRFDGYVTRLEMACRIVTEDFVYPHDRYGNQYGWGWSLLTTPETLFGRDACLCSRTPEESHQRLLAHFRRLLPHSPDSQLEKIIG